MTEHDTEIEVDKLHSKIVDLKMVIKENQEKIDTSVSHLDQVKADHDGLLEQIMDKATSDDLGKLKRIIVDCCKYADLD